MKVVIIEDEIRIREGLSRLIGKLRPDYTIAGDAEDGIAGLQLILQSEPDIIFTDIRMPGMDGLQMLSQAYEKGCRAKAIVLSAYSEFEYARQAMRLGVKEYILKPLSVGDISESLFRVETEIQKEQNTERIFDTPEQIFLGVVSGTLEGSRKTKEKLAEQFSIAPEERYSCITIYLGSRYESEKEWTQKELTKLMQLRKEKHFLILALDREKLMLVLVYGYADAKELERWVQYWLLQDRGKSIRGAVGFVGDLDLAELNETIETLIKYMEWNISLGDEVMISYPKITRLQTNPCVYPLEIEHQMKQALCTGQGEKIDQSIADFYASFQSGEIYEPREIKGNFVRFLWTLLNTASELGMLEGEKLEQQLLLEQVMRARTAEELYAVGKSLTDRLDLCADDSLHLTVKRAQGLIREFYQSGITLDEIAAKMKVTPEYLSTRFHRETGVTFSNYIKNYRLTKAKELLIGTDLKLYEIADQVGYADAKYFSRVFRETTGQLPADYRKTHR